MKSLLRDSLIACVLGLAFSVPSNAMPSQPKESSYTLELEPFAEHAGTNAMELTHANDGSGRIFVSTQSGQVYAYAEDGSERGVFIDLAQADPDFRFDADSRYPFRGLMYIAFHPDYARQGEAGFGRLYTGHQVELSDDAADFDSKEFGGLGDSDKRFALVEWRVDPSNPDRIDPASGRRVMLLNFHTYSNNPHALGEIAFNPYAQPGEADHGKLYIAVGDSHNGDYSKPHNLDRAQRPDNPFAKILRINPLPNGDKPYSIPEDNPFGTEVYATGLRDAQWFSFAKDLDGQTVLVACDIGALLVEEINIVRPGGNYGWARFEGALDFETERQLQGEARPPVVQYGHAIPARIGAKPKGGMTAIMGGLVVSDPDDPSFQGQILFGDLPRGTLMHANYHHALAVEQVGRQSSPYIMTVKLGDKTGNFADVLGTERGDARFGVDEAGHVYIISKQAGTIFKTGLIYTGLPVKADPVVSRRGSFGGTAGLVIAVGGIGAALTVMLAVVMWRQKPNRPEQNNK
ncbi:MAG: PQQ-dependent sugar dehydrogenase [Phycisphaeraceae bacterium]|nr:PQQ-dependent sugar dehydrogenase [Phycisphaeraceae bacterium]